MKLNFKEIFKSTVYITPNFPNGETVRYRFKFSQLVLYFIILALFIMLLTLSMLSFTPLKNVVFLYENSELRTQAARSVELEKKIVFLTKELESISSTNKKLEYAFILATSDSIDSTDAIYDSLKYEPLENLPYGGNIYAAFTGLFTKYFLNDSEVKTIFIKPSKGLIINEFNPEEGHFGIDFAVTSGSSVFAANGGVIIFADFTLDDGNKIIIQHDNGYITIYKHCSQIIKKERDVVVQGELIGLSGNTGKNTTGPHLHFEIWKDGRPINPKEFFIK
ncbi:MAG: peptidoglycan DD-metalloendopeptidase family protein [Ignavibacteriales bacterium]|nr:peptidoglycan DD-metalloendopeptidase family protein [Ignavibacteriota bacterium]MCB9247214.1 peptidoglycan DD-metalloendopeptidase family protein [Ignavibacteriales bacterium]